MEKETIKNKILALTAEAEFPENKQMFEVMVPAAKLHEVARMLKNDKDLTFDYLFCMTAVDWKTHFVTVHHLESVKNRSSMVLKTKTDRKNPAVDTVCDIWPAAEWFEREVFDMFGIKFNNHHDLRRMFLDDDYVGYPLRKDFVDPINIIQR